MTRQPEGVQILRAEDAGEASALHALCFPAGETWSETAFRDSLALTSTLGLATGSGGRLTGLILLQRTPPDAEILTLAVHPDHRRQGLARTLLTGARTLLGPYGVDRLLLDVAADNTGAISFYESMGFLADGRRMNYYPRQGGKRADAILMSRAIAGQSGESEA